MGVSALIDKLDLQETIRQKARIYFNKEQKRMQERGEKRKTRI